MLKFRKLNSAKLKNNKLFLTFATSNFQGLFVMKFDSKSNCSKQNLFSEGIYLKKKRKLNSGQPRRKQL